MNATGPAFEGLRPYLHGLAYRMLGSQSDADDIVQEAWLRWTEVDRGHIDYPRAFLSKTVTRLCLDRLKSAQATREVYVGPWLPEPLVDEAGWHADDPASASEHIDDVSVAFMLALERLSPLERAAFLLHDVFDCDFAEVATVLGRTPAACRQLASRARSQVRAGRPRFRPGADEARRLLDAFEQALSSGDPLALKTVLAEDARFVSDGGGRIAAAQVVVHGAQRVAKLLLGLAKKHPLPRGASMQRVQINDLPGYVLRDADGAPIQTVALECVPGEARVASIYIVRNPDKLRHLRP